MQQVAPEVARRIDRRILGMIRAAGAGHPGGSLSVSGILTEILLHQGQFGPRQQSNDWLVLAKGHAAPALYAVLCELGWLEEGELATFKQLGSRLQGHPDRRKTPGVQISTGHLGQGLSIGVGLAWAGRYRNAAGHIWVVLGEGDLHEGQTWEAAMSASQFGLGNLTAVVDANGLTQHGPVSSVMSVEPLAERFASFGWHCQEIDGHDPAAVAAAFSSTRDGRSGPSAVIARTVKGHGISFMEGNPLWHSRPLSAAEYEAALTELEAHDD